MPPRGEELLTNFRDHPALVMLLLFAVAMLFGFPAVLSACSKLAEAVMERTHPPSLAFDHLAKGDRSVRVERIRAQHGEAQLPPSLRDATVFFADIRGFTSFSERLSPEEVVSMLNRYFDRVVTIVEEHQGYLNKFIGDAVVVVFAGAKL